MMELMSGSGDSPPASNVTDDLSCAARDIQGPPDTPPYSEALLLAVKILLTIIYYTTFIASSLLNIFLLYLIIRYKKLHVLTFSISLQIVALDLLQLYGSFLFRLVTVITDKWVFGTVMCALSGFIFQLVYSARSLLMCVFVIDRFLSVFAPYFYPRHSKKITITLSVVAWLITLLSHMLMLPGVLDCIRYAATEGICIFSGTCSQPCAIFGRVYLSLIFIPSTILPIVFYILLCGKVREK